jgi:gluconate kinase
MTPDLLTSQLKALEPASAAFEINADDGIDVVTARVIARMRTLASNPRRHC